MDGNPKRREITKLPDYSAVKKLAAALWQQDKDTSYHGAAIMIGAGFSRCAATTGDANKRLPLWVDLSSALAQDLSASNSTDPLRLAEEYFAYFGKQALHDLIKKEINDAAWSPGEIYKTLLELPWSEVMTTNWDTLLERAAMEVHQRVYSLVSRQEDLASAPAPRIVKLHGTINVTADLVFTQEDYRRYPQKHAAFVNFARQVFIENELVLLGFSGDDPNFLQWTGWVRDNLTTHARRIYLVGALHLTAAKRKYLESINIAPIDLWNLVTDYDDGDTGHAKATEIFLQALSSLKPKPSWKWSTTQLRRTTVTTEELDKTIRDPCFAASLLERQIPILASDRESYPGWLVCPSGVRWQLQTQLGNPFPNHQNISQLVPDSRAKLLYEIVWRHSVTYQVSPPWLIQEFLKICDPANPCILSKKKQMEIALHALKNTRWFDNCDTEVRSVEKSATAILENNAHYWPESADELRFHQAIIARDKFDYPAIEKIVEGILGKDPICRLRKAALLVELGKFDEGETLIAEAYRELLSQYRNDRNSIYVFSRLAWAHWLLRGVQILKSDKPFEAFPSSYEDRKCDPWNHIENIKEIISKALEKQQKQQGIEPSFEPGRYNDNSNSVTFSNEVHPILLFEGVSSGTGMPLRWDGISFLVEPASRLVGLDDVDGMYRFSLAIRTANSDTADVLKKVFSRIQVACIPQNEATHLLNRCIQAIEYWTKHRSTGTRAQRGHALDRLRVFIEVLARVLVRATPEEAKRVFRLAMELGKNKALHHIWLFDALQHLIQYALESIPESQHHELLLDALLFPLQAEIGLTDHGKWPNPVIKHPGKRNPNTTLERRIDEIIDRIAHCSPASSPALLRLFALIKCDFLTANEKQKIAEKIWGATSNYQVVPETGLLNYVLLQLPSPDQSATRALVRNSLFEKKDSTLFEPSLMMDIANAAQAEKIKEFPDERQAIDYFNRLTVWRAKINDKDPFGFSDQEERQKGKFIGEALAQSIVPSLTAQVLTEENFDKLHSFYAEVDSPASMIALVYFAHTNEALNTKVERIIRRGLQDQSSNKVAHSAFALLKWRELANTTAVTKLISRLIYLIESGRTVGLPALLWTVHQMYNKGWLSEEDLVVLTDSIPALFDGAHYKRVDYASRDAVSVSFTRAACVKLARDILNKTQDKDSKLLRVLEEARNDALPEVRFAEAISS
jgi:hypothetical protein